MSTQVDPGAYRKQLAQDIHKDLNALHLTGDPMLGADQGPVRLPELGHETPPPVPPEAPPPPPETPPETPPEPDLIFGKYKDLDAARKGYFNLLSHATKALNEKKRLEAQLAELAPLIAEPQTPGTNGTPRVNPAQRSGASIDWTRKDAVARFAEKTGIETTDLAEFARAIHEEAATTAQQAALEAFAPIQIQTQAQAQFSLRHPEAARFQPELAAFTERMEPIQKAIAQSLWGSGQVYETMEYVWDQFQRTAAVDAEGQMQANSQATETQRVAARQAAAVGSSSPGTPVHAADPRNLPEDREVLNQLAQRYRSGDANAGVEWRRRVFGAMLPPHLRTWEQQQ